MNCEEARWQEFESEAAQAHAAGCAACGEWMADGVALRSLAAESVPARVPQRRVTWMGLWAVGACAAAVLMAVLARPEVSPPPMPEVAVKAVPITVKPVAARVAVTKRTAPRVRKVVEAVVVRLETADPDVVIYWTFESGGAE